MINRRRYWVITEREAFISYPDYEMVADLNTCKIDVAFTGSYNEETVASIAVNKNNKMQYYYTTSAYPDAKIVFCDTAEDCLEAVLHGKAGSTILNGIWTNSLLSDSKYSTIVAIQLGRTDDFCFGVADGNDDLLLLLNRGLRLIGDAYGMNGFISKPVINYGRSDADRLWRPGNCRRE